MHGYTCICQKLTLKENLKESEDQSGQWAVGRRVGSGGGMKQQAASNDFSPRKANSIVSYICNLRNAFSGLF